MAVGTVAPNPKFHGFDNDGNPLSGGLLYTYSAGTTTPLDTYSDVNLTTPNANPVVLDAAGRATIYLTPASYKFIQKDSAGNTIWTQDNVSATLPFNVDLDVEGTAGEDLIAGQAVYLSGGDGGQTAGQWYLADADLDYASTTAGMVGLVPADIASGATGSIRLLGRVTDLSGLIVGAQYYVSSTAGEITATQPTLARFIGIAESVTTLVIAPNPPKSLTPVPLVCDGRLSLTTGDPNTTSDISGASTMYYAPYVGNRIALYDGVASWSIRTFTETSISLAALTASTPYDVFAYDNAGDVTFETLAWSNATTRATGIVRQDGVFCKVGALTRRYIGTVYINSTGGQSDDTLTKRYLYNHYNRERAPLRVLEATDSWTYTTDAYRQMNGNAANQVDVMVGVAGLELDVDLFAAAGNSTGNVNTYVSVGEDGTTEASGVVGKYNINRLAAGEIKTHHAHLRTYPSLGRHRYLALERSTAAGTTTWYGDNGDPTLMQSGLFGSWWH
jgi:hypothetical protein